MSGAERTTGHELAMGGRFTHRCAVWLLGATLLAAAAASAQGQVTRLEFTFSNPGARSMGFGGAFAPLADDATAAFANPAGLVQLLRPELSGELRIDYFENDEAYSDDEFDLTGLGFASFVVPLRRWSFAVYGHRGSSLELTPTETSEPSRLAGLARQTALGQLSMKIRRFGVAAAYQFDERFSLGLGGSYFTSDITSDGDALRLTDHEDVALNAGVLWTLGRGFRLGGFYREGPRFEIVLGSALGDRLSRPLAFPDAHGAGLAYTSGSGRLTLATEWSRVGYSSLNELAVERGDVEDTDEYHLGAEYAFLTATPIVALRFGAWLEPAHQLVVPLTEPASVATGSDEDELHFATGLGLAWESFQIDFGLDIAQTAFALSISGIVSF